MPVKLVSALWFQSVHPEGAHLLISNVDMTKLLLSLKRKLQERTNIRSSNVYILDIIADIARDIGFKIVTA